MKWEDMREQPVPKVFDKVLHMGHLTLMVSRKQGQANYYCHAMVTTGLEMGYDGEPCLETWPREAIARIRQHCDEAEAMLNGEEAT